MQPGDLVTTKIDLDVLDEKIKTGTVGIVTKVIRKKYYNESDADTIIISCANRLFSVERMFVKKIEQN
jgi:hypothetical protein